MEGWTNSTLRAGSKQESKTKGEASVSADFTEQFPLYRNYPMLTKTSSFSLWDWSDTSRHTHVCVCVFLIGHQEGQAPRAEHYTLNVTFDSHMEGVYGVSKSRDPPFHFPCHM